MGGGREARRRDGLREVATVNRLGDRAEEHQEVVGNGRARKEKQTKCMAINMPSVH